MIRIERNSFLSGRRRGRLQVDLDSDALDRRSTAPPTQEEALYFADFDRAMDGLPDVQRQAFVGVSEGRRYDDLASMLGVAEGTVRSRVFRARAALARALETVSGTAEAQGDDGQEAGAENATYAAWKRSGTRLIG